MESIDEWLVRSCKSFPAVAQEETYGVRLTWFHSLRYGIARAASEKGWCSSFAFAYIVCWKKEEKKLGDKANRVPRKLVKSVRRTSRKVKRM